MNVYITIHDKFVVKNNRGDFSTLELENQIFVSLFYSCSRCFLQFTGWHINLFFLSKLEREMLRIIFLFRTNCYMAQCFLRGFLDLLPMWLVPQLDKNAVSQRLWPICKCMDLHLPHFGLSLWPSSETRKTVINSTNKTLNFFLYCV